MHSEDDDVVQERFAEGDLFCNPHGAAESSVNVVKGTCQFDQLAVESASSVEVPADHDLLTWLVKHRQLPLACANGLSLVIRQAVRSIRGTGAPFLAWKQFWSTTTEGQERLERAIAIVLTQAAKEPEDLRSFSARVHRPEGEGWSEHGTCCRPGKGVKRVSSAARWQRFGVAGLKPPFAPPPLDTTPTCKTDVWNKRPK